MNESVSHGFRDGGWALYTGAFKPLLVQIIEVRAFGCSVEAPEMPNSTFFAYFEYLKHTSPLEELARCAE